MRTLAATVLFLGLSISACSSVGFLDTYTGEFKDVREGAKEVAGHLDAIAKDLEEFGTASVSAAAVIRRPQDQFGFRLNLTPREIFEKNRIVASSAALDSRAVEIRIAAAIDLLREASLMSDAVEAATTRGRAEGLLASGLLSTMDSEGPEGIEENGEGDKGDGGDGDAEDSEGDDDDDDRLKLPTNAAKTDVAGGELSKRAVDALDMPLRQLIQLTFDDHTTLKLFEWLSEADPSTLGENKYLFAAILNVSLRPGWRTERGYIGEVDVSVGYGSWRADGGDRSGSSGETTGANMKIDPSRHPLAFAVLPMVDSQVMDLRSSVKRQLSMALMAQVLAPKSELSAQAEFASRLESQIASITPRNTVTSYSMSGRHFGWRFMPRLDALGDPSSSKAKAALRLEPQSFPVLVFLLADREDLSDSEAPVIYQYSGQAGSDRREVGGSDAVQALQTTGEVQASSGSTSGTTWEFEDLQSYVVVTSAVDPSTPQFDHFVFHYSMRWLRAPSQKLRSWWPPSRWIHRSSHPRLTEFDQVEWGLRIAEARSRIQSIRCQTGGCYGVGCGEKCSQKKASEEKLSGTYSPPAKDQTIHTAPLVSTLEKRLKMLEAASVGADVYAEIPDPRSTPAIDAPSTPYRGWQNRENSFAVRGKSFMGQVHGATIEGRFCKVEIPSDETVVVKCDPWKAKSTSGEPMTLLLITDAGPMKAGTITFDLVADDETKIAPFAKLNKASSPVIAGKTLRFAYEPSGLPVGRGEFKLFLRRLGGTRDDWRSVKVADVHLDKSNKEMRIAFEASSEPSWMRVADRLEVDVRLARNETLQPASILVPGSARDFVNAPKRELLSPKVSEATSTVDYGGNNTTDDKVELDFAGGLDAIRRVYRDTAPGIATEPILLEVAAGSEKPVVELKLVAKGEKLVIEAVELNKKEIREALLPAGAKEKKYDVLRLSIEGFDGKPVPVRGRLTVKSGDTSF